MQALIALGALATASCQVVLPPGLITCGEGEEANRCPEGWMCDGTFCVEGAADGGERDANIDAGNDGAVDEAAVPDSGPDSPPTDVSIDVPFDAGPPPPFVVFGGSGTDTVDAIAVDGDRIFVAGTTDSANFCIPNRTSGVDCAPGMGGPSMYVAQLSFERGSFVIDWLQRLESTGGGRIEIGGLAFANDLLVVGGSYTGGIAGVFTPPTLGESDAFLMEFTGIGARGVVSGFGSAGDDGVRGVSASNGRVCAVGAAGGPVNTLGITNITPGGFLVCFPRLTLPNLTNGGRSLRETPSEDVYSTGDYTWIAWKVPGNDTPAAAVNVDRDGNAGSDNREMSLGHRGVLVATNADNRVSMIEGTYMDDAGFSSLFTLGVGLYFAGGHTQEYEFALSASTSFLPLDMLARDEVLHIVGRYSGDGTGALGALTTNNAGGGFHVRVVDGELVALPTGGSGTASLNALANHADGVLIGGSADGDIRYPLFRAIDNKAFLVLLGE